MSRAPNDQTVPVVTTIPASTHSDGESSKFGGSYWWPQMPKPDGVKFQAEIPPECRDKFPPDRRDKLQVHALGIHHINDETIQILRFDCCLGDQGDLMQQVSLSSRDDDGLTWPIDLLIQFVFDYSSGFSPDPSHSETSGATT